MPTGSYGEVSEEMEEPNINPCSENGTVTELTTGEDKPANSFYNGYQAPRFLYRRRNSIQKPKLMCPNSTTFTTSTTTTTEGNEELTTVAL